MGRDGSITHQVIESLKGSFEEGTKKHDLQEAARENGPGDSHSVAQQTPITSFSYAGDCKNTWVAAANWCKGEFKIKSITDIKGEHLKAWLEHKVDTGLANDSAHTYAGQLEKFAPAINKYAESKGIQMEPKNFHKDMVDAKSYADNNARQTSHTNRAYDNADRVIDSFSVQSHQIAAGVERYAGCRLNETSLIKADQLKGDGEIWIDNAKNGQSYLADLKAIDPKKGMEIYDKLAQHIRKYGEFRINKSEYYRDLKAACDRAGERYEGKSSHGFRYGFAQGLMKEFMQKGMTRDEARRAVSEAMNHHRPTTTDGYTDDEDGDD